MKAKRLVIDIETFQEEGRFWNSGGGYQVNISKWTRYSQIASFAWKWVGQKQIYCMTRPDYKGYRGGSPLQEEIEKKMVEDLVGLLDEADIVIYQNGKKFDRRKINSRAYYYSIPPPSFYRQVDTYLEGKKYFDHPSHKLNEKAKYGGFGEKEETGGLELWDRCEEGDMKAWRTMKKYNKHDVWLCEQDYFKMLPWIENHPNLNIYNDTRGNCPKCGSANMVVNKHFRTTNTGKRTQFRCKDCLGYSSGPFFVSDKMKEGTKDYLLR